jgi:5-methylthioadenosine/S-adenosylhomocysteine deaminase
VSAVRLRARWVVTLDGPPLTDGALLIGADGRIAAVGPDAAVPAPDGVSARDLGDAILAPGLVNTHTHLELTALRGLVRERPMPAWVQRVRLLKEALGPAHRASARWGVLECAAAGITTVGDTGSSGEGARALADLGLRGVAYQEVFGPDPAARDRALAGLDAALSSLAACESDRVAVGLSPHAPYTVSASLLAAVCERAATAGRRLAMHLAESPEEVALVRDGKGLFAERLRGRGVPVAGTGRSPVRWALERGLGRSRALAIHVVHADEDDLRALSAERVAVAHCPWSNAALGNGRADLAAMRRHGLTVGVGTDSVAAGGGLDLFAEARLAAAPLGLEPRETLRLVTRDAAAALDVADVGVLRPGAWGDCIAVGTSRASLAAVAEPEAALALHATAADVVGTWVAGRARWLDGAWPGVDAAAERDALEAAAAIARHASVD